MALVLWVDGYVRTTFLIDESLALLVSMIDVLLYTNTMWYLKHEHFINSIHEQPYPRWEWFHQEGKATEQNLTGAVLARNDAMMMMIIMFIIKMKMMTLELGFLELVLDIKCSILSIAKGKRHHHHQHTPPWKAP